MTLYDAGNGTMNTVTLVLLASAVFVQDQNIPAKKARDAVTKFEQRLLKWDHSLGTPNEPSLQKAADTQRAIVVRIGGPTTKYLRLSIAHKNVRVRRGSAIALIMIADKHKITDRKLLDAVLLRMVKDDDIKVRSNLYHVASTIIANIAKRSGSAVRPN